MSSITIPIVRPEAGMTVVMSGGTQDMGVGRKVTMAVMIGMQAFSSGMIQAIRRIPESWGGRQTAKF